MSARSAPLENPQLARIIATQLSIRGRLETRMLLLMRLQPPLVQRQILNLLDDSSSDWSEFLRRSQEDYLDAGGVLRPDVQLRMSTALGMMDWARRALEMGARCTSPAFIRSVRYRRGELTRTLSGCMPIDEVQKSLSWATRNERLDVVSLLVDRMDIGSQFLEQAIADAVHLGDTETLQLLLRKNPRPETIEVALFMAQDEHQRSVARLLDQWLRQQQQHPY